MKADSPTFSIIIPHKNIPELLMRCLKSIPVSEDIQVIVVDDNSRDADTYLDRYPELSRPYLEFIPTTKGGGAGYARNVGLDRAKGKWLMFADSDDFYEDNMQDIIYRYVDSEEDIVFFKIRSVLSADINVESTRETYINTKMDRYFEDGDEWPMRADLNVPWAKMVKKKLIVEKNIRFDEVMYSNDVFFSLLSGYYAKSIKVVNEILYVLTYRPGSLTASPGCDPNEPRIRAEVAYRSDIFLLQRGIDRRRKMKFQLRSMLKYDRKLFKYYFFNLDEIYPSKRKAIDDISNGSLILKVLVYLYVSWLWITRW